jgi:peptide/nickel transport system permease protein
LIGAAIPYFLLGGALIYVFALQLGWLPASGYVSPFVNLSASLKLSILPTLTLGLGLAAITTRQSRSSLIEVLHQGYIMTARAKGLQESRVIRRHALKNALLPVVTILGLQLGNIFGGAVITETIFAIPGMGRLLVESIFGRDYPVVQAIVLFISVTVVLANLVVDILYAYLDPRIRL